MFNHVKKINFDSTFLDHMQLFAEDIRTFFYCTAFSTFRVDFDLFKAFKIAYGN